MKIMLVYIAPFFGRQGGVEKVFSAMANALVRNGHEVSGVVFDTEDGEPFFPLSSKVKLYNIGNDFKYKKTFGYRLKRMCLFKRYERHILDKTMYDHEKAYRLKPVIELICPDIIISFGIEFTRIIKTCIQFNCPIITQFHSVPKVYLEELVLCERTKQALDRSECLQVLIPSFVADLKKYTNNNNIVVIPNAVSQFNNISINKRKVITNVGRVSKEKRQHLLIEAFNKLKDKFPNWEIEIWGDLNYGSEYYKLCIGLVKKYNLENRILFCGITDDIVNKLMESSIFAFPSEFEGFPLALTEAMSVGLPSIGFKNCPSVNELIRDKVNGILCNETIDDFAEAMEQLMSNADKRNEYGMQAKEDMKQYAPEKIWGEWEKLIENIVSNYDYKKGMESSV